MKVFGYGMQGQRMKVKGQEMSSIEMCDVKEIESNQKESLTKRND